MLEASGNLERSEESRGLGGTNSFDSCEFCGPSCRESPKSTDRREKPMGDVNGVRANTSRAELHGQELGIAQRGGAELEQALAGAVVSRNVPHRCRHSSTLGCATDTAVARHDPAPTRALEPACRYIWWS